MSNGKEIIITYDGSSSSSSSSLKLYVDMKVGLGGDKWPAADLFIAFINDKRWKGFFTDLFHNKTIMELGSGTGLGGMIIDKEFEPKQVVVSDIGDHIEHMDYNIKLNNLSRCQAIDLDWFNSNTSMGTYDFIIALECVYKHELYEAFIKTMDTLSNDNTIIFLGLTRNFQNGNKTFWDMLRKKFHFILIPQESLPYEYHEEMNCRDCGIFVLSKKKQSLF